jgi:hypothetical protein
MMHHGDKSKLKLLVTGKLRNAVMLTALAPVCFAFPYSKRTDSLTLVPGVERGYFRSRMMERRILK